MHEKEIEKLQVEKEKVERQLAQEQHKIQRLENRATYYEKGERRRSRAARSEATGMTGTIRAGSRTTLTLRWPTTIGTAGARTAR